MDENHEISGLAASVQAPVQPVEHSAAEAEPEFIGTYTHSVDAKGRMVVPASFREGLGETFYIAPSEDFSAVALYPNRAWHKLMESLKAMRMMNDAVDEMREQFTYLSYSGQMCDAQGRVLLPTLIRDKLLGPDKDLEISGAGDHVNIMTTEMAMAKFKFVKDNMPSIRKTINQLRLRSVNMQNGSD